MASRVELKPRMQNDVAYATASARTGTFEMSSSQPERYGGAYDSVYSSIFGPRPSRSSSVAAHGVQSNSYTSQANRNKLYQSPPVQNSQEMVNRHRSPFGIVNGIRVMSIDGKSSMSDVMDKENAVVKIAQPRSISVRSNGSVELPPVDGATNAAARTRSAARSGTSKPVSASQNVYIHGRKKEEVPLELEVFTQGMFKTELCNKWQESSDCHCRLADGIEELCPVIRKPHYKTEVCSMVLAVDVCPYSHPCHFCHALTEEDKQLAGGNNKPKSPTRLQTCSYPGSHGTTILWIRLASVVLVGVDSMAIRTYLPDDPKNKRVFSALDSVTEEKFVHITRGVFATLSGDGTRCVAMKDQVREKIGESNHTLDFDTICHHANEYFSSHHKLTYGSQVDLFGWIEDEKRHKIIRVGDDFQTVDVREDVCSGIGSGSEFVMNDLIGKAAQYSTMEISEGVEWLKHLMMKACIVYCLEEGKEQLKYAGDLFEQLDNSEYAELFFNDRTMLVIIEKKYWDILTAEDLQQHLLESFNEEVEKIHWLGWPNDAFLMYRVVLSSKKARSDWFESCQRFKAPVRQKDITISGVGSCRYYLGFATKSLFDRARKMTKFDDLASSVKRY